MDGGPFPADHMQHISPVSAVEVELRRHLVQFAPHMVPMLDELLQEERSRMRQQEYEMMYMQEEYQNLKDVCQQQQQDLLALKAAKDHAENQSDFFQQQYARVVQQFGGGGGGQAGFASSSPVFVPAGVLGAVDGGGMLGDIDAGFKGLDLDGLDNGSGGVFGGNAPWGGWAGNVNARGMSAGSGAGVGFPGLDGHGMGVGGAWSLNSQGMAGGVTAFQLPTSKLSTFGNVPSMNSLPSASGGMNAVAPGKKKSPKLQGADINPSFPPPGTATLQSSAAQLAVKPPASFAQVAAEKAKAPTVASKVTASASAAGFPGGAANTQASGQAVLRMRGLPYSATENDLVAFFEGFDVVRGSVRFGSTVDGRPSGEGWVGFSSLLEAQRAMKDKDRQHIGDRYVEIFLHQVGDTVYGQKFARGGRGGGGSDGATLKHEVGSGNEAVKMNSGDIFKKLSREVIETGLPASDVKESLHKLQDEGFTLDKITREQLQERVMRLMKEKETWREGAGGAANGKKGGGSGR